MAQFIYTMKGLGKVYPPDQVVFKDIWLSFLPGAKIGVIGSNGAGKSTLLKIMAGMDPHYLGEAFRAEGTTVGFLQQEPQLDETKTVLGNVEEGVASTRALLTRFDEINEKFAQEMSDEEMDKTLAEQARVQDAIEAANAWDLDARVEQAMDALRLPPPDADVSKLSGGERRRVALCRLLLQSPDLLLLDEPTNHLDLDARNWLESYLIAYPHPVILVSHDRYFLDAVVTKVADLSLRTITDYIGTYSFYLTEYDARMNRLRKAKQEQDDEVARMKAFIDRFRYQATKAAQVQSRIKMLDKVEIIEVPPERKHVHFTFPSCPKSGRMVMELTDVRKAYGLSLIHI